MEGSFGEYLYGYIWVIRGKKKQFWGLFLCVGEKIGGLWVAKTLSLLGIIVKGTKNSQSYAL